MQIKTTKADRLQTEIYRKMPARKKLEITIQFYQAGQILNKSKNASSAEDGRRHFSVARED